MTNPELTIDRLKTLPYTHWQEGKNPDTTGEGYFIEYSGSLWAGQANAQNTISDIISLAEQYHFEPFTFCAKTHGMDMWRFRGNFKEISNVFSVLVWNRKLARKLQRIIREKTIDS